MPCRRGPVGKGLLVLAALCILTVVSRESRAADSEALSLRVIWPPENAVVDGERVRVGGHTDPKAAVTVDGKSLRVFPSGAFAGTCPIRVGPNELEFRATRGGKVATASRSVRRPTPLATLPSTPVRFDPNYDGQPSEELVVRPGDTIEIRVKGSPGHKASFRMGDSPTRYPLFPASRYGAEGFYEGAYQVRAADAFAKARITCYLAPKGRPGDTVEMKTPGSVTVNANPFPDVARAREDYARLRAEPHRGAPLLAARQGTYFCIDGRVGDALRVALTPALHGWIPRDAVELVESEPPLRRGVLRDLSVREEPDATVLRIPLGLRVPFAVRENPHSTSIELTLYGVQNLLNWITDRTPRGLVETIAAVPVSDSSCRFDIALRGRGILGYRGYYDGETLCLALRNPPPAPADPSRPLAGRTILLDPGHGGSSPGTLGSTGIQEKAIDFTMAGVLRRVLEERGARVRLTRTDDSDVSLAGRCRQAEEGADLFVSLHNNSVDLMDDPLAARGMGVFYFHPHARSVAQAVFRRMAGVESLPDTFGLVTADLYVIREVTAMPSLLLECLFLSNPEDEMLLLDQAFVRRDMEAVADGITDWLAGKSQSDASGE